MRQMAQGIHKPKKVEETHLQDKYFILKRGYRNSYSYVKIFLFYLKAVYLLKIMFGPNKTSARPDRVW
jgi:hypothetical protein